MSIIEIGFLIVLGVVTWLVASEGVWGAAQTFLCTLLAGLIAMNYFEPLAAQLRGVTSDDYADIIALLGLFIGLIFALRMGTEQLAPSYIQVIPMVDTVGRWAFGVITGYLTIAILLTSLHTAPLPREFLGFKPENNNFFGSAPDRQWLGFVQYVSEHPLAAQRIQKIGGQDVVVSHAFDGRFEIVGDPTKPYTTRDSSGKDVPQVVWPSFPIRYAMRRSRLGSNQAAPPAQPVQVTPPAGGGGAPQF